MHIPLVQNKLIHWFGQNARILPWRIHTNWYKTFLSEIILQQTTVDQGLPFFNKIYSAYPNIQKLALADEHDILKLWAGLGYYARARNMLKAAKIIADTFNGEFPREMKTALQLPGIGPYSAAAILSIAFKQPFAVLDGNVLRVLARFYNNQGDIRKNTVKKELLILAQNLLPREKPGVFNEALMELGAAVCTPAKPDCEHCPFQDDCGGLKAGTVHRLPHKSPARKKQKRFHLVMVYQYNGSYFIRCRPEKGLLAGMWEFPCHLTDKKGWEAGSILTHLKQQNSADMYSSPVFRQLYSHIDLTFMAVLIPLSKKYLSQTDDVSVGRWITPGEFSDFPIHTAHKKVIHWLESMSASGLEGVSF